MLIIFCIFTMNITFANKKIEKYANNYKMAVKKLGQVRAKLLHKRLLSLRNVTTLEDVRNLPGKFHELTTNRKGQWACDLDQPYRLIFTPTENPIPMDESGRYIWMEIADVEIVEITNYHKEG